MLGLYMLPSCHPARKTAVAHTPKPIPMQPSSPGPGVIPDAANVMWLDSERLMPVLEEAQQTHKPVFVVFHASWCAPCKVMDEDVFTQQDTYRFLNANFLNFRADVDTPAGKTVSEIYEARGLPTILFLDPQGVVLERHLGIANPSDLKAMGERALGKMKE